MLFTYVCGTEGRGTRSHHRVCWPYHTPKHMAHRHSVRRRTLENTTEMMILICIVLAYKPRFSCARQTLPVWKHNGRALLTLCIRNASALLTRRSRLRCETGVRAVSRSRVNNRLQAVFGSPVHWTENRFFRTRPIWEPMSWWFCACVIQRTVIVYYDWHSTSEPVLLDNWFIWRG